MRVGAPSLNAWLWAGCGQVAKKQELDALRSDRETVDHLILERQMALEAISQERLVRAQHDAQRLDALLQRADVLRSELSREDTYSLQDRARFAAVWAMPSPAEAAAAASGSASAASSSSSATSSAATSASVNAWTHARDEVLDEIQSRRARRHHTTQLAAQEHIRSLNAQRQLLHAQYQKLLTQQLPQHQLVLERGVEFATQMELGQTPPLQLLLRNRHLQVIENDAKSASASSSSSSASVHGFGVDTTSELWASPFLGALLPTEAEAADSSDLNALIERLKQRLPTQTAAFEQLRAQHSSIPLPTAPAPVAAASSATASNNASDSQHKPSVAEAVMAAIQSAAQPIDASAPIGAAAKAGLVASAASSKPYAGELGLGRYPLEKRTLATTMR